MSRGRPRARLERSSLDTMQRLTMTYATLTSITSPREISALVEHERADERRESGCEKEKKKEREKKERKRENHGDIHTTI